VISQEHRRLLGAYRMPAEWDPHRATYLVWPHNRDTWPGKFETIPPIFAQIAAAIASFEPVRILVEDEMQIASVGAIIRDASAPDGHRVRMDRIELLPIATNDSWIRDFGPIFVNKIARVDARITQIARADGNEAQIARDDGRNAQIALDFRFNSWGEKYGDSQLDDVVPRRLGEHYGVEVIEVGMVLEGGSIDVNGAGVVLTTESCLLNKNRNPNISRGEIEEFLKVCLGATQVLWLGDGITGDDTDGHVDDLARFVASDTIVTVFEQDPADANYKVLQENLSRLRSMRDASGRPFRIETLPMPPALFHEGTRLPASYANFYIVNGGVIMPTFGCAADSIARATLERVSPGRRVVGIPSTDLVWGLGAIHCLTQQHPTE
jgi:agmatine deiminase